MGFYFRAVLIASFFGVAQVRVIIGDIEHFYGPGGQLLDDAELRTRSERVERSRRSKEARPQSPLVPPNEPGRSNAIPAPISGQTSI
jgi:hypothetical protein